MNFEELQLIPPILKALAECGHSFPTAVQSQAIPKALSGCNLIVSAQTGTGKTAAFVLPALQTLSAKPTARKTGPRVLVVTPTRELADQVTQATRSYGKYLSVSSVAIFGGMPFGEQIRSLSKSPDMIIATPGRLLDLMNRGRIDLSHLELFILDEADRMLDMGFIEDVERILAAVPADCQTLLFAATVGEPMTKMAQRFMKNPERIQIAPGQVTHDTIDQRLLMADDLQHKTRLLQHFCDDKALTKAIIFSATKCDADSLARDLNSKGYLAAALHGDMTQYIRNRTMRNMRSGKIRLLVATDVAARGLDVRGISHIINFDLPRFAEDYVHRIGRTGRAGESGIAISFAFRSDFVYINRIERYLRQSLTRQIIPGLEPAPQITRPTHQPKKNRRGPSAKRVQRNMKFDEKIQPVKRSRIPVKNLEIKIQKLPAGNLLESQASYGRGKKSPSYKNGSAGKPPKALSGHFDHRSLESSFRAKPPLPAPGGLASRYGRPMGSSPGAYSKARPSRAAQPQRESSKGYGDIKTGLVDSDPHFRNNNDRKKSRPGSYKETEPIQGRSTGVRPGLIKQDGGVAVEYRRAKSGHSGRSANKKSKKINYFGAKE
ncbi:MAG TPA: DEAD/DEAH box helicase [Thermodesulfobacteriota bacterium]|nr:DEAD/DEAH box helicase [Thermodesulfobacteriota bacterium]